MSPKSTEKAFSSLNNKFQLTADKYSIKKSLLIDITKLKAENQEVKTDDTEVTLLERLMIYTPEKKMKET